jgi:hypothetical protein
LPLHTPESFCFLTIVTAVLDSTTAVSAAAMVSGVTYPAGASSV